MQAQNEIVSSPPAKTQTRRRTAIALGCAVAAIAAVVASGVTNRGQDRSDGIGPIDTPSPTPIGTPSPSPTPSDATFGSFDMGTWTPYTPKRWYEDRDAALIGYPPDWTVVPATRDWSFDTDAADPLSPAYESFVDPNGDIRVSLWEVPGDTVAADDEPSRTSAGTTLMCEDLTGREAYRQCVKEVDYVLAWADDYCKASGIAKPCSAIQDHAIEMCLEKWDCHPGVLVPFESAVLTFLKGPIHNEDSMIVVAVWRGESDPAVARYGGAQRLLEGFLTTMQVWPASTPRAERTVAIGLD